MKPMGKAAIGLVRLLILGMLIVIPLCIFWGVAAALAGAVLVLSVCVVFLLFFVSPPAPGEIPPPPQTAPNAYADVLALPFPCFVLKNKRFVDVVNPAFAALFPCSPLGKSVYELIPGYDPQVLRQKKTVNAKECAIYTTQPAAAEDKDRTLLVCCVENDAVPQGDEAERIIVGLVFIDNYDEAFEKVEESRRPLLTALIDRKLNAMAQKSEGILRKFEKDRYIFLFSYDKLAEMKEKKFDILEQIRDIDMGNKIPVTLSIGMGIGETLAQSMEYARNAIDLALGRGGDQVLIKDGDKYYFYGGQAKDVGVNTRVRARVKADALTELIYESQNVIIMGHRNPDLDCLGSAIGVYKIVESLGKECNIVLNEVTTNISTLYARLMQAREYRNGLLITSEEAMTKTTPATLLIIVDTHRPSLLECKEMLQMTGKIVVFDHHRKNAEYVEKAVLTYHEPYSSSTSELITEMLQYIRGAIRLLPVEADALLAGITVDTKNFAFKTGAKTFEAAAYLRRNGADTIRVRMLFQNDMETYRAKVSAVNSAEIYRDTMAIAFCPAGPENPSLITAQAADDLLNISGIQASYVMCESKGMVMISARSLGEINVQMVMEKLGGGGHQTVAGVQIPDISLEEAKHKLKGAIDLYIQEVVI